MKAFEFKLKTLLRMRELEEKEILSELIGLKQLMHEAIDKLITQKNLMLTTFNGLREKKKGKLDIDAIQTYERFIKELENQIKEQQRNVIEARVAVEAKNKDYIKASKKRKIVEKYKEKCLAKFNKELLEEEYKFQDEFAVIGHNVKTHEIYGRHKI
jgi:flagellar protein FliJ